jgi:hypothetical protein
MIFEVELISSEPKKELGEMTHAERVEWVTYKKETGNYFYGYGALEKATKCYQEAIKSVDGQEVKETAAAGQEGGGAEAGAGASAEAGAEAEGQSQEQRQALVQLGIDCGNNLGTCLWKRKMHKVDHSSIKSTALMTQRLQFINGFNA